MNSTNPNAFAVPGMEGALEAWRKAAQMHVDRLQAFCDEYAKAENRQAEQVRSLLDEAGRLARESINWSMQMTSEWRKNALETTRRVADFATKGA